MGGALNDSNGEGSHFHQIGIVRAVLADVRVPGGRRRKAERSKESVTRKVVLWDS